MIYLKHHLQSIGVSLKPFIRSPFASGLTVAVLGVALALPLSFWLLLANLQTLTHAWDNHTQISLFLKNGVTDMEAQSLEQRLRSETDIAEVTYISPAQGLETFQKETGVTDILEALGSNPLPAVLEVHPVQRIQSPEAVRQLVQRLKQLPDVASTQLDMEWVKRLYGVLALGQRAVAIFAGLLALGVLLVIGNTIRLMILNAHSEIKVIKLVGGSNRFIRRPFLYSGIFYGLGGGLLAVLVVHAEVAYLRLPVQQLASLYGSHYQVQGLNAHELGMLLMGAAFLGLLGAWLAVAHQIKKLAL